MGLADRIFRSGGEITLTSPTILEWLGVGSGKTAAKEKVSTETALGLTAAYRAVAMLSGLMGLAPLNCYTKKTNALQVPRLFEKPNDIYTAFEFWELMTAHLLLTGDAVALLDRKNGPGTPVTGLLPLDPNRVQVTGVYDKRTGALRDRAYEISLHGRTEERHPATASTSGVDKGIEVPSDEIFHVMDLSIDGLAGRSKIRACREALSTAIATDKFAGKLFGNGSLMSGVLTTEKRLTPESADALRARWNERMSGLDNAHDIAILDNNAKFQSLSIPPEDAQFLQARQYGVTEVARIFGVAPYFLFADNANNVFGDGVEGVALGLERYTLNALAGRFEGRIDDMLLPRTKRSKFYFGDLSVPDARTRASAGVMWRTAGVKSINELRVEEGLEAIDDPNMDDPTYQMPKPGTGGAKPGDNQDQPDQPAPTEQEPTVEPQDDSSGDS